MTQPENPDQGGGTKREEKDCGRPSDDLQPHASGKGRGDPWPRSNRDPTNETFRCGYWGGKRTDGKPCVGLVVRGTKRCWMHSGVTLKQAKARGAVVTELDKWGLDGHTKLADPGEILLRLLTQSAWRVEKYAALLARAYEAAEAGESFDDDIRKAKVGALIGYRYGVDRDGNRYPIEEAIRGLVQLEANERAFARDTAAKAIAAGLAERQVRIIEQQGQLIVSVFRRIEAEMDFTAEQVVRYTAIVGRELRAIAG